MISTQLLNLLQCRRFAHIGGCWFRRIKGLVTTVFFKKKRIGNNITSRNLQNICHWFNHDTKPTRYEIHIFPRFLQGLYKFCPKPRNRQCFSEAASMADIAVLDPSEAPRARRWDALILGSGLSALLAAARISSAGHRVLVVEEEARTVLPPAMKEPFFLSGLRDQGLLDASLRALTVPLIDRRRISGERLAYQIAADPVRLDIGQPLLTAEELVAWGLAKPDDARRLVRHLVEASEIERTLLYESPFVRLGRRSAGTPHNPAGGLGGSGPLAAPTGHQKRGLPDSVENASGDLGRILAAQVRALSNLGDATPAPEAQARLLGLGLAGGAGFSDDPPWLVDLFRKRVTALYGDMRTLTGDFELVSVSGQPGMRVVRTGEIWLGRVLRARRPASRRLRDAYGRRSDAPDTQAARAADPTRLSRRLPLSGPDRDPARRHGRPTDPAGRRRGAADRHRHGLPVPDPPEARRPGGARGARGRRAGEPRAARTRAAATRDRRAPARADAVLRRRARAGRRRDAGLGQRRRLARGPRAARTVGRARSICGCRRVHRSTSWTARRRRASGSRATCCSAGAEATRSRPSSAERRVGQDAISATPPLRVCPEPASEPARATPRRRQRPWPLLRRMLGFSARYWTSAARRLPARLGDLLHPLPARLSVQAAARRRADSGDGGRRRLRARSSRSSCDLVLLLGVTLLFQPVAVFLRSYGAHWTIASVRRDVDQKVAGKFLGAPLRIHRAGSSGDFLARALNDVGLACQSVTLIYNELLINLQLVLAGAVALFLASWQLALFSLLAMPPFFVILSFFGRRIQTTDLSTPGDPGRSHPAPARASSPASRSSRPSRARSSRSPPSPSRRANTSGVT